MRGKYKNRLENQFELFRNYKEEDRPNLIRNYAKPDSNGKDYTPLCNNSHHAGIIKSSIKELQCIAGKCGYYRPCYFLPQRDNSFKENDSLMLKIDEMI